MTPNDDYNAGCEMTIHGLLTAYVQRGETINRSLQTINRLQDRCDTLIEVVKNAEAEEQRAFAERDEAIDRLKKAEQIGCQALERAHDLEGRLKRMSEAAERDMLDVGISARPGPDVMTLGDTMVHCCRSNYCRASIPDRVPHYVDGSQARQMGWSCLPGKGSQTRWVCPVCTAWQEEGARV